MASAHKEKAGTVVKDIMQTRGFQNMVWQHLIKMNQQNKLRTLREIVCMTASQYNRIVYVITDMCH